MPDSTFQNTSHITHPRILSKQYITGVIVPLLFVLSGTTGLIYEILWSRMIVGIIGSAPYAISIVLTVFMGGIGIGNLLAGRFVDHASGRNRLLSLYGIIEIMVGIYAIVLPMLLRLVHPVFSIFYTHLFDNAPVYHSMTFVMCSLMLLVPAILMGATLPVLSRWYVRRMGRLGGRLGTLYGLNTLGAAVGSFLCGFILIDLLGVTATLYTAAAINAFIGCMALILARQTMTETGLDTNPAPDRIQAQKSSFESHIPVLLPATLTIFAVSGFCGMSAEVIWTKLLALIVGPTTYSFTVVTATFILGLALGSMLFGFIADRTRRPFFVLIHTQILAAIIVLCVSQLAGNSQIFFAKLIVATGDRFMLLTMLKTAALFAFMFIPTVLYGASFPLVIKIVTPALSKIGRSVGNTIALNTVGSVAGSFAAGFILIPLIGKESGIRFIAGLQIMVSVAAGVVVYRKLHLPVRRWIPLVMLVAYAIAAIALYPTWNRTLLSVGMYHRSEEIISKSTGWLEALFFGAEAYEPFEIGEIVYFGDGAGGFTTVKRTSDILGNDTYSLFNSGKADASTATGDMYTQTMLAHFPLLFHSMPDTVMVLGLASGITAGEALLYPVRQLDVVDINRQVVEASDFFRPWNNDVLDDPRTNLIIQDGRAHLELTDCTYDVIISEPSNPWMAGLAALFTEECFTLARNRLAPGGIFCQWVHGYQIDWEDFALIGRTFARVFPHSLLASIDPSGAGGDYLLVGFVDDIELDRAVAENNLQYAGQSSNVDIQSALIPYRLIESENLTTVFGDGPLNTDDRPLLEFAAPRVMFASDTSIRDFIVERGRLEPEIKAVREEALTSVDEQISYAAYAGSFDRMSYSMVDIGATSPAQLDRYLKLLADYCATRYVTDYRFFEDETIGATCRDAQISLLMERDNIVGLSAEACYHLANLHLIAGSSELAITWYQRSVEQNPIHTDALYSLAWLQSELGNYESSVDNYRHLLRLDQENVLAHHNLGNALVSLGDLDGASIAYRNALDIDPTMAVTHRNLGLVLSNLGENEEAERHLTEADRLESSQ